MSSTTNKAQGGCSDDTTNVSGEQQQASSLQLNNVNNNENNSSNATSNDSTIDDNSSAVDSSIADDDDDETSIANNINDEQQLQLQLANDNGSNDNNNNDENELQLSIDNNGNDNDKNKRKWQAVAGSAVATLASSTAVGLKYGLLEAIFVSASTAVIVGVGAYLQHSSNRAKKRLVVDTSSTTIVETSSTAIVETSSTTILSGELGPPPVMPPPSELLLQEKRLNEIVVRQNMMNATAFYSTLRRMRSQKQNELISSRRRLSLFRRQNSGIRNELARASHSLAACATQIQLAQNNATTSRGNVIQVHAKLERTIVIAQQLVIKQNQVLISLVALQKIEVELVAAKAQAVSTLESATQRRDEVEQRRESLLHAIQSNALAEQKVEEAISEVRDEIDTNERDLTAAQEEERQNELRLEVIELEFSTERARHANAVVVLERECEEVDIAKDRAAQSIEDKKAMIEQKKAELLLLIEKCNELSKSEGHDGTDQVPTLDIARVRARVREEESTLRDKKVELESLRQDVSSLDTVIASNTAKASEKRQQAEALQIEAAKTRAEESLRKLDIAKAVDDANLECQEVNNLRIAYKDLTDRQEKVASDLKTKLDYNERVVSSKEEEISSTRAELDLVEQQIAQYKASTVQKMTNQLTEIDNAKHQAGIVKAAHERAQKAVNDFSSSPDDELIAESKRLDEMEKELNRERDEMIEQEPLLEKLKFDFNSVVPLEEQKAAGRRYLQQHCQGMIETAETKRAARLREAIRRASVCYLSSDDEDDSDIDSQADEEEMAVDNSTAEGWPVKSDYPPSRGDWPVVPDPRIPDDWKEIRDGYFHPAHGPIHHSYILHFLAQLELEKNALPTLQVDLADLTVPSSTPTSTTSTNAVQINQDVAYGKPLALTYSGAGKSVKYHVSKFAFTTNKKVPKKKVPNGGILELNAPTTRVAAFIALTSDVFNFLMNGEFERTLFSSLTELEVYVNRDTRIARDQDDTRPVESLADFCSSLLNKISSFIKDKRVKDKGIKDRHKELKRILSPGNDGTFPHIDELWSSNDGNSDSEEDTESESEDTDQDTNRLVKASRRSLHVVKLFSSLGQAFNVTECVDGEENKGISIIKKKYDGSGCSTVLQETRHQTMRKEMFPRTQEDWRTKYGVVLDPSNPQTLVVGPDKYIPASHRPNDDDENVSQEHIESAEARWNAMNQQFNEKLKQEQGDSYNPLFEQGDESSSRKFFSIEDYEESIESNTIALHQQYNINIDRFHDETPLSIKRLKHFQSQSRNTIDYTTLIGEVKKVLEWMKQEFGVDLELCQVITFTPEQYIELPRYWISNMVDNFYTLLSPDDTCRFEFCKCKLSEIFLHGSEQYAGAKDHTKHGVETHGRKVDGPSQIHNLVKKREEMRKCLVVLRENHDMRDPSNRSYKINLSRYRQLVERAPGNVHLTGEQVVTSKQVMGLFLDIVSYGGLRKNTKLTSRSINAMLVHHTGLGWSECTNQPRYYWDKADYTDTGRGRRWMVINSILSGLAKRLSEKCANPNCRNPDMVNKPTMGLSGDGDWEHDLDKDSGVSKLSKVHPIHTLNEIMRWCAVTCAICHGRKTWLNKLEFLGRVFDVEKAKLKEMFDAELAKLPYCVEIP